MSRQAQPCIAIALAAIGAIGEYRFVTPARAQAGAAVNTIGVARMAAADKDVITVDVLGTAIVETGGVIADGGLVETDASGRAVAKAAGVTVARLLPGQASTALGQFVEVLLIPN